MRTDLGPALDTRERPVPFTLTAKAHAALGPAVPDQPVPFTLTAEAHAALDQDGPR